MPLIYIVEDDKDIVEIEKYALESVGYDVETYMNAKDFYYALDQKIPSLILLDIMLPDEDGFSILKTLKSFYANYTIPIIMVSAKGNEIDKVKGLESGADDYIAKPFGVMELLARVKALLRRTEKKDEKFLSYETIFIDDEKHKVYIDNELIELTYKEYELLKVFIMNQGIVLSREVLMNKVWGMDYEGETRTVDMHVKTLRHKLGKAQEYIKTIRNVGYVVE